MLKPPTDRAIHRFDNLLLDLFDITASYRQDSRLVYSLAPVIPPDKANRMLRERLELAGYQFELTPLGEEMRLVVDPQRRWRIPRLNVVLFVVTLLSVYLVPIFYLELAAAAGLYEYAFGSAGLPLPESWDFILPVFYRAVEQTLAQLAAGAGLEFTLALMSILIIHEMGHFLASRRRMIVTSWPYFIPAPNILGTLGAVIKSKSPFWNRRDLIEVGAAGPIAGWIVAIGWLVYGLSQSVQLPVYELPFNQMAFSLTGESLTMRGMILWLIGSPLEGHAYLLTEAAFAGWVGLLVTALNMLPIGQFDGGHILYGLGRSLQHRLGRITLVALVFLGFLWPAWWLFGLLGLIFGVKHPPTIFDDKPLPRHAVIMGVAALVILVVSFPPMPVELPWEYDFQLPWQ